MKNKNVKVILEEDKSEPSYMGKEKKKSRTTISMVMPDWEEKMKMLSKFYNEQMNKVYSGLRKFINLDLMCKILDIEYRKMRI